MVHESFVPGNQWSSVLYCRLSDFICTVQSVNDGLSVNLRKPLKTSGNWPWRFQIKTNMDLKTRNWFVHPNAQCFSGRSCISQISIIVRFFCTLYAMIFFSFFFLPNFNICKSFQTRENLNWEMVFCYQNCSDLLWEKVVLLIEKNFWNSRLKAENLQNFWEHWNNLFKQGKFRTIFGNRMLF